MSVPASTVRGEVLAGCGPDGAAGPVEVVFDGDRIESVTPCSSRRAHDLLCPGFIDLQVNGIDAMDVSSARADDWALADASLSSAGVTAWLPTLISAPLPLLDRRIAAAAAAAAEREGNAVPQILGVHLEGPFLGSRPGAHPLEAIVPIDRRWLAELPGIVRLVTVGAEDEATPGAIAALRARDVVVSLGHTAPTSAQIQSAIDAGASMITHVFNAMAPLHHRDPGLVGAAMTDPRLTVGLIADGVHVDASLVSMVFAAAPGRVALVSDAVGWRSPVLAELEIAIVDGAPRLADGTIAGSALTLDAAIKNCVDAGIPVADAVRAASRTPASVLGDPTRGRLLPGARADVTILDADLTVRRTIIAASVVSER